jgi:hypothetical protein
LDVPRPQGKVRAPKASLTEGDAMPTKSTIESRPAYSPQPPPAAPVRSRRVRTEPREGLLDRLRVRWRTLELDHALARGGDPLGSNELQLRADQLNRPDTREGFANEIEDLVARAEDPDGIEPDLDPEGPGITFQASRDLFEEISAILRGPGPHPLRGVAMASVLLRDQGGPLYADSVRIDDSRGALHANGHSLFLLQALRQTRAALTA